ncbi:hypothetical protein [Rhizobium etli]|uniref:hypothetical protein n=1 Tax=Rhizobium etli TaxID=29449 RepID=UPI0012FD456E|nr:hypothetical protein [Rhizobium etli]
MTSLESARGSSFSRQRYFRIRSVALDTGFANFLEIEFAKMEAVRLARSVEKLVPMGKELASIRDGHGDLETLWRNSLRKQLFEFADRMMKRSRFATRSTG